MGKAIRAAFPPDRWQQWPHAGCKPLFIHLPVIMENGLRPSRVHQLLRASPQTDSGWGGVAGEAGGEVRGERTLDVWLEKKSVTGSADTVASQPTCSPLRCSTPRFSSASGQL